MPNQGFTVIELIVAMALFLITVPATLSVIWQNEINLAVIGNRREALNLAKTIIDHTRVQSINDFSNVTDFTANDPTYQTTLTVTPTNLFTKKVDVTVTWKPTLGPQQEIGLTTIVTDGRSALSGNTCLIIPNSQSQPFVDASLNFGAGNEATGSVVRNHLVYVTTNAAAANLDDFFVVNVSNPTQPAIIGRLHTGPGLSSIAVRGNYAFVGNTSINGQLQIIDISFPQTPALKTTYKLPGTYNDNTTIPNTIAFRDHKVYLGTHKSQIAEFHIIDVSNAAAPQELGTWEVGAGINAIDIVNEKAYLASPANEELNILDVSNAQHPEQIGSFDATGGSGNGKSLAVIGTTLALGRTVGGQELYLYDTTDPSHLRILTSVNLNTSINGLNMVPGWLFLATTNLGQTIQLWNISNRTSPTMAKSLALPNRPSGLSCGKDKLYANTPQGLTIITP